MHPPTVHPRTAPDPRSHSAPTATNPRRARVAFTLIELLVVISIIALLVAILIPVLAKARTSASDVQCLSNLRQVGASLVLYANDNADRFPDDYTLAGAFYRRAPGTADPGGLPERYGLAAVLHGLTRSDPPAALDSPPRYLAARSGVWTCPAANDLFRAFGNTYSWAAMPTRTPDDMGNWNSKRRSRNARYDGQAFVPSQQVFLQDEWSSVPYTSGVPLDNALPRSFGLLPSEQRSPPHRFRTRERSRTATIAGTQATRRAGSFNVLFIDGSTGRILVEPFRANSTIKD